MKYIFAGDKRVSDCRKGVLQQSKLTDEGIVWGNLDFIVDFILILKQDIMEVFCLGKNVPIYIGTFLHFNNLIVYTSNYEEVTNVLNYHRRMTIQTNMTI